MEIKRDLSALYRTLLLHHIRLQANKTFAYEHSFLSRENFVFQRIDELHVIKQHEAQVEYIKHMDDCDVFDKLLKLARKERRCGSLERS
jgi:hypothetical protein